MHINYFLFFDLNLRHPHDHMTCLSHLLSHIRKYTIYEHIYAVSKLFILRYLPSNSFSFSFACFFFQQFFISYHIYSPAYSAAITTQPNRLNMFTFMICFCARQKKTETFCLYTLTGFGVRWKIA